MNNRMKDMCGSKREHSRKKINPQRVRNTKYTQRIVKSVQIKQQTLMKSVQTIKQTLMKSVQTIQQTVMKSVQIMQQTLMN